MLQIVVAISKVFKKLPNGATPTPDIWIEVNVVVTIEVVIPGCKGTYIHEHIYEQ